jgi:hypothetical protein
MVPSRIDLCDVEISENGGYVSLCVPSPNFNVPCLAPWCSAFIECRTKVLKGLARIPAYNNVVRDQCPRNNGFTKEQMFTHLLELAKLGEKEYLAGVYTSRETASALLGSLSLVAVVKKMRTISNKDWVERRDNIHVEPTAKLKEFYSYRESVMLVQALIARKVDCMLAGWGPLPAHYRTGAISVVSP